MNLVIGKEHTAGRGVCAVVFDRDKKNKVLYRSYAGFNKRGKADCQRWLEWAKEAGWLHLTSLERVDEAQRGEQ